MSDDVKRAVSKVLVCQSLVLMLDHHIYIIHHISRASETLCEVTYVLIYGDQYLIRIIHPL